MKREDSEGFSDSLNVERDKSEILLRSWNGAPHLLALAKVSGNMCTSFFF